MDMRVASRPDIRPSGEIAKVLQKNEPKNPEKIFTPEASTSGQAKKTSEDIVTIISKGDSKPVDTNKTKPHNDEDALAQVKLKETPMPTTSERTTNNQKLTNKDEQANGQTMSALNPNKYSDEGETKNFNRNAVKDGSNNTYTNRMGKRRKAYDEEEEDGDNRRRRRPAQLPLNQQKKSTPSIIEGAKVGESQTQDMFVSSAVTQERITGKVNKTIIEQIKEFSGTDVSDVIYNIVSANYNHKEKNGIGSNMQKELFGEMLNQVSEIDDVISPEYRRFVRNVVQGAMLAGFETKLDMKDLTKMLVSGFMAMSPHDDNPSIMSQVIKNIVNEVMYGKINIGYNMKSASYWLGAASYTLVLYYKNYQTDIEFNRDLEQKLNIAFSENIWNATGEISNYSQVSAKANVEQFMAGRMEEEKIHSKNYVKDMVFSPLKKVFNR